MNSSRRRTAALVAVALACFIPAVLFDVPWLASIVFPSLWLTFGERPRCLPAPTA